MAAFINASTLSGGGIIASGDSSGILQLQTGGVAAITVDASQNVGVGTTSPNASYKMSITGNSASIYPGILLTDTNTGGGIYSIYGESGALKFRDSSAGVTRAIIDTSGNLLVGQTTNGATGKVAITTPNGATGSAIATTNVSGTAQYYAAAFYNNGTTNSFCGGISVSGTTTTFATSSDYRLKENVAPMTGALNVVAQLKPCTYSWKSTGESTQGFIAHELQEVVPECVVGEKDAVDEKGNPRYQGIDTSFLVATLTAAIQELKTIVDTQAAKIAALEVK